MSYYTQDARKIVADYLNMAFGATTFTKADELLAQAIINLVSSNLVEHYARTEVVLAGFHEAQETIRELSRKKIIGGV